MKIGFTGTRSGLTESQTHALAELLVKLHELSAEFHHGDCIGSDHMAHIMAREIGYRVILHPPTNPKLRAFCQADEEREPLPYLTRNQAIVNETDILIATPRSAETLRSGTWATIRYALSNSNGSNVHIIMPQEN